MLSEKDGLSDARNLSCSELVNAIDMRLIDLSHGGSSAFLFTSNNDSREWESCFSDTVKGYGFELCDDDGVVTPHFAKYFEDWQNGVRTFYNEISEQL